MNTHSNSVESFAGERRNGRIGRRSEAVLLALRSLPTPPTDRQVAEALGFVDLNAVRPRITELIEAGLAVEVGAVSCPVTGKTVRITRALSTAEIDAARAVAAMNVQGQLL